MLKTQNISIQRPNAPLLILPDILIEKGDHALLLGPSGSGKTSFLSVISGLLHPSSGQVLFEDTDIYHLSRKNLDALRGKNFGLIFQALHLLPTITIRQNIDIAAKLQGIKISKTRIEDLLSSLGISDKANRKPDALSQGEQQRAAIARALVNHPSIILADEPTSALDDENADKVAQLLIQSARDSGAALIIATHDARILKYFPKIITLTKA